MRLKVLLGACLVGTIGVVVKSNLIVGCAAALVVFSCVRHRQTTATNYTEKFGPPDPDPSSADVPSTPFNSKLDPEDTDTAE